MFQKISFLRKKVLFRDWILEITPESFLFQNEIPTFKYNPYRTRYEK